MIQVKGYANLPGTSTPISASALRSAILRAANWVGQDGATGPGVAGYEDFRVKQRVAGAAMAVDVGLAGVQNAIFVAEDGNGGTQRYEWGGAQLTLAIAPADPTNPRIDRVVAEAPVDLDSTAPLLSVLTGTPTGGATADNLSGAAAVAANRVLLADIVVGAGVVTIVAANIRDRRGDTLQSVPWLATGRDQVQFQNPNLQGTHGGVAVTTHDNMQAAVLMYLPRRIVNATRIRWRYKQGGTAATSNYNLAIADVSGRVLVSTGAVAFTGAAGTYQERAEVITATTFEAGWYFVFLGLAAMTASSSVLFPGISTTLATGQIGPVARNEVFRAAAGGTTVPTTILGLTDVASLTADTVAPPVPLVALSVG